MRHRLNIKVPLNTDDDEALRLAVAELNRINREYIKRGRRFMFVRAAASITGTDFRDNLFTVQLTGQLYKVPRIINRIL